MSHVQCWSVDAWTSHTGPQGWIRVNQGQIRCLMSSADQQCLDMKYRFTGWIRWIRAKLNVSCPVLINQCLDIKYGPTSLNKGDQGQINYPTEIWHFTCSTCYGYFYPSATLQEMWPLPTRDNLYIILTAFSRRFWIWPPKFDTHSVILAVAIFILQPHCGKCDPYQLGIIYISFWPHFQGDSESGHQNFEIHFAILAVAIFILQPHFRTCDPGQIEIIYISFWLHFQYLNRDLKFHL